MSQYGSLAPWNSPVIKLPIYHLLGGGGHHVGLPLGVPTFLVVVTVAEQLKMVSRLHAVLLSILPTGAALVYLLWTYGWKKPKVSRDHHCQKQQIVEPVSCADSDQVDTAIVSCGEQLVTSVNNEEDNSTENQVSSGVPASDDVCVSPISSFTDLTSPSRDESPSATAVACEQTSESAVDVGNTSSDHDIAVSVNECHSVNVSVSSKTENITNEYCKTSTVESQENNVVTFLEDENCCNGCIAESSVDVDKINADSGCVRNIVSCEECENGRRDSVESVRTTLSLRFSMLVFCLLNRYC